MPFSSPVMLAEITIQATGEKFPLWQPDFAYLTGMKIELVRGGPPTVTVTMEASYEDGLLIMQSGLLDFGNLLSVRMGYSLEGVYTPWYYGMTTEPAVTIGPDGFSCTLTGSGGIDMMRISASRVYQDTTAREVLLQLFRGYGFRLLFDPGTTDLLTSVTSSYTQGGETDWEFARKLCAQFGVWFWMGTDADGKATVFFKAVSEESAGEVVRRYRMKGNTDIGQSLYPMLSFSTEGNTSGVWAPAVTRGAVSRDVDLDTKEVLENQADDTTSEAIALAPRRVWGRVLAEGEVSLDSGLRQLRGIADEVREFGKNVFRPRRNTDPDEAQREIQAKFDDSRALAGITANISTIGNPYQLPMELIKLEGLSPRFDGIYTVHIVEHINTGGDWVTNIQAISDGYSEDVQFGEVAQANQAQPEEGMETVNPEKGEP